jgi:hypothetical protein
MGRRGPAPTPTKVKMVRGETRSSRLNLHEPLLSPDVPEIPGDMDAEAKIVVPSLTVGYVWHAGVHAGEVAEGLTRIGFEIVARCVCHRASGRHRCPRSATDVGEEPSRSTGVLTDTTA